MFFIELFAALLSVHIRIAASQLMTVTPDPPTLKPAPVRVIQNMYMKPVIDDLPALETITDCKCPRVYIPVCGTDHRSYTNICKMNCANHKRRPKLQWTSVLHMGVCQEFFEFIAPIDDIDPFRSLDPSILAKLPPGFDVSILAMFPPGTDFAHPDVLEKIREIIAERAKKLAEGKSRFKIYGDKFFESFIKGELD